MTDPTGPFSRAQSPRWRVWSPRRLGGFRWSMLRQQWFDSADPTVDALLSFVYVPLLVLEFVLVMPTVGLIRLAIHHARSPGWSVQCRYGIALERPTDPTVELEIRTKRQAKRLRRALRREFDHGADFNAPAVHFAIAGTNASIRPATPPPSAEPGQ